MLNYLKKNRWLFYMDKSKFQTGDILLFHHKNDFSSWASGFFSIFTDLIMWATGSKYSHCAIVIRDPNFTAVPKKGLFILESSYENFPDIEDNEYKLGCELEEFDKVIDSYKQNGGQVYWRKLNCTRDDDFYLKLAEATSVLHNRPYDLVITDWIKAAFHINKGNTQNKKRFWCSALVAYVYTKLGFIPENTPWTIVSAKTFGTEKPDKYEMQYQNCSLDKEIQIV